MAHIASAQSEDTNWKTSISRIWNQYVNMAYFLEEESKERDDSMREEFAHWKNIKPIIKMTETGLKVSGIRLK